MDEIMSNIEKVINDNLKNSINSIFDIRNDGCVDSAMEFMSTLSSIEHTTSDNLTTILHNYLLEAFDKFDSIVESDDDFAKFTNMKNNMEDNSISNQPISEVEAFSTLYDKGYIEDSYMQKHIARQNQELKSTFSNLMGGEWNGSLADGNPSKTIQVSVNDWIDADFIVALNDNIRGGEILDASAFSIKTFIGKLLVNSKGFEELSIIGDIYVDINTNAFMCVNFAVLASLIAGLESNENNLKRVQNTMNRLKSFGNSKGVNDFFACSCMVLNAAYHIAASAIGNNEYLGNSVYYAKVFSQWYDGYRVLLPNRDKFPHELSLLLKSLQSEYEFRLTKIDLEELHIPVPVLMSDMFDGKNDDERQSGMILEESVKIGQSLQKCICGYDVNYDDVTVESQPLDSLVERFQVESEGSENTYDIEMTIPELHKAIAENSNRLFHNASRHENDALKSNLAMNVLLMEKANFVIESKGDSLGISNQEKMMIWKDLTQMEYQNERYIGIVEAYSNESVLDYANSNRTNLLKEMAKMVKRV